MKYIFKLKFKISTKGFTLIELLVVIGLFTTVMTVAVGALFTAQSINTKLQQTQVILDGVNLTIEQMVRDIRYSSSFYCTDGEDIILNKDIPQAMPDQKDCLYPSVTGNTVLVFKPVNSSVSSSDRSAYYLSNGAIYKKDFPGGDKSQTAIQITSPSIKVDNLSFYVKGSGKSVGVTPDYLQPVVTISIAGVTQPTQPQVTPVNFTIQTTSSSRKIDE